MSDSPHPTSDENPLVESVPLSPPPALPPKPQELPVMRPSYNPGAGWLRIVGSYRKGVLLIVVEELRRLGFHIAPSEVSDDQISVFWSRSFFAKLPSLRPHQKVNWMPGMNEICRKDFLGRNITRYARRFGWEHFDFWPNSFNLPHEWDRFIEEFQARPVPYILKPPLAARGEGIRLFTQLSDASKEDEYVQTKIPLAQRYIPNPLLFHGKYKMSFRFYVALTSVDPLRIYIYQDGLVRICSTPYTTEDFSNLLVHLTNYDLQIVNESNFVESMSKEETECRLDGLRADWQEVKAMLRRQGHDVDRMWSDIQDLVVKSFIASESLITRAVKMYVKTRGTTFEVTGFDVLLDESLKPWLLEVNHTPSLCPHTSLENDIKRHMLRDLYQLVDLEKRHVSQVRKRHDILIRRWKAELDSQPGNDAHRNAKYQTHVGSSSSPSSVGEQEWCATPPNEAPATSLPVDPSIFVTHLPQSMLLHPSHHDGTTPPTHMPTATQGAPKSLTESEASGEAWRELAEMTTDEDDEPTQRSRASSSVSSTTGMQTPQLEFPLDNEGHILPDKFVSSDLWCILDADAEVRACAPDAFPFELCATFGSANSHSSSRPTLPLTVRSQRPLF